MHDLKFIKNNMYLCQESLEKRGVSYNLSHLITLDTNLKKQQMILQNYQNKRNEIAKKIGEKRIKNLSYSELLDEAETIKALIQQLETEVISIENTISMELENLPNLLMKDVPQGNSEDDNIEVKRWGRAKNFEYIPKNHYELGEMLSLMDFNSAAYMSGSRFVILKSELAMMERALANFMLDIHTKEYSYEEISPPYLVKNSAFYGVGQLPKFEEDSFFTREGLRLISTSEVPLTNLVAEKILKEEELPLRYTACTPCFRSEAGSAGRDTKGMIRLHQFPKVELVSITRPQDSKSEHERMISCAEEVLKRLELPYKIMLLCSKDTGFSSQKTYDIEVWLPGQNQYREISSCSIYGDFQARRMKARYKELSTGRNLFVHTLNGSALAIGRTIVAIIENYQNSDNSIDIPDKLQSYMNGKQKIYKNYGK